MLAQRVAAAVIGIPIIIALIWLGGWPYAIVVALALAIATAELQHFWRSWRDTIPSAALVAIAIGLLHDIEGTGGIFVAGVALGLIATTALAAVRVRNGDVPRHELFARGGIAYVAVLGAAFVLLRDLANGRDWVFLALFSTFAVDTAAYFTGRAIGRHKMAPSISPKKTWEGFAGGYAGGFAAVFLLNEFLGPHAEPAPILLIAATLPAAAAAGDLFESWLKRRAGVKDASDLIPGHGGVLDRLDSLLFTFPVVYIVARWFA